MNTLYTVGGHSQSLSTQVTSTYKSTISTAGVLGVWQKHIPLPLGKSSLDGALVQGHIVVVGGAEAGMSGYAGTNSVYSLKLP